MFVTTFRGQFKNQPNIIFIDIPVNGINENVLGAVELTQSEGGGFFDKVPSRQTAAATV
jgi:hypothetical protein